MPDTPIVDAHQHFWIQNQADYPWLVSDYGPIYRDFEPSDLRPHLVAAGVDGTVLVQAANSYADTEAMLRQAEDHDWIWGVVGWVPLPDHREAARKLDEDWLRRPGFCGVRHLNHEEPDACWIVRDDVLKGLKELEERDLVFDVVAVYPDHLEHIPLIASLRGGLRIVVDHLAKPPVDREELPDWRRQLAQAASHENVYAKISGLNTALDRPDWSARDLRPAIEHAVELFGVSRLMFGSDWPVALLAGTYEQVWSETLAVLDMLGLSSDERAAVLGGTAKQVYRLAEV